MLAAVAVVLCGVQPTAVLAQAPSDADLQRAEAKAIEAKAFFKGGLYSQAAAGFMEAYAISHRPDMMYNAARAYEEAGRPAEALALFRQYVNLPDAPADGRRDARERIDRLQQQVPNAAPPAPPPAPRPTAGPAPVPVAPGPAPRGGDVGVVAPQPAPARSRWLSWSLLAGGGVFGLAGLAGWAGAVNDVNQANDMDFTRPDAATEYRDSVNQARSQRNGAVVLGVAAVGLAGWGAWRLWGPEPEPASAPRTTWTPLFDPADGTAGLAVGGAF